MARGILSDLQNELNQKDADDGPNLPDLSAPFKEIIKNRRSVRLFTDEKIPQEIVEQCLEMALMAPNSSNLQPWEFYWITDPKKKEQMVEACYKQPAAATSSELFVCVARTKTWRKHAKEMLEILKKNPEAPEAALKYYQKLVPMVYTMGPLSLFGHFKRAFFTVAGLFNPVPREPHSSAELKTWAIKSSALACQNLMMAFSSFGYDTCPMEGLDSKRVKKIIGAPRDGKVVMAISAGRRKTSGVYGERIRFESSRFIIKV